MFPIFAFSFFLILYLLDLTFTLLFITIPIATFIAFLTNIFLFFWLIMRIGVGRTLEKLKSWKTGKRFFIQAGANFIPILDFFPWPLWFIYREYKEEKNKIKSHPQPLPIGGEEPSSYQGEEQSSIGLRPAEGESQEETETEEVSERQTAGAERLQELEEERQSKGQVSSNKYQVTSGKVQDASFKPQVTSDQMQGRGENTGVSTISEVLSGRELLPTSPEAFEVDYSGKKMPLVNQPEYYENIITQQNKIEKERAKKLAKQNLQGQKESSENQLAYFSRLRDQAVERFGPSSKYAQRLIAKVDEMNPKKKDTDELN